MSNSRMDPSVRRRALIDLGHGTQSNALSIVMGHIAGWDCLYRRWRRSRPPAGQRSGITGARLAWRTSPRSVPDDPARRTATRPAPRQAGVARARMRYTVSMEAADFDEEELFSAIARSGVRALLIGRRALVAL